MRGCEEELDAEHRPSAKGPPVRCLNFYGFVKLFFIYIKFTFLYNMELFKCFLFLFLNKF